MSEVGLMIGSGVVPEKLAVTAARAEAAGLAEVWLAEDFFFTGGFSAANTVLAATARVRVGLGVVSAMVRHPALLAMEIATTARAHPGRFVPGIGVGVPSWMRQMGVLPKSPVAAVRECLTSVRRLLEGETLEISGEYFDFDRINLTYPKDIPIHLGGIGPKMLQLSGEIADGSILSVGAGTDYIRWARERIEEGRARGSREGHHRVTAFAIYSVDGDREAARAAARGTFAFYKAAGRRNALTDVGGITETMLELLGEGGVGHLEEQMPETWIDEFTIAGDPEEVVAGIRRILDAGVDSVALVPVPGERAGEILDLTAAEVLPRL